MRSSFSFIGLFLASSIAAAIGDEAVVEGSFVARDADAERATTITSASMEQRGICLVVHGTQLPEGDHEFRLTIQDGKGTDVYHWQESLKPMRGRWRTISCYGYNRQTDAPGNWTFTVELDGRQVLERDIDVAAK